jgi:hypothetical protein
MCTHVPRQTSIAIVVAVVAALGTSLAVGALGGHGGSGGGGEKLAEASLAPSMPTDPVFHAVAPGGAP